MIGYPGKSTLTKYLPVATAVGKTLTVVVNPECKPIPDMVKAGWEIVFIYYQIQGNIKSKQTSFASPCIKDGET